MPGSTDTLPAFAKVLSSRKPSGVFTEFRRPIDDLVRSDRDLSSPIRDHHHPLAEWREIFPSAAYAISLADRPVHNAEIVAIEIHIVIASRLRRGDPERHGPRLPPRFPRRRALRNDEAYGAQLQSFTEIQY